MGNVTGTDANLLMRRALLVATAAVALTGVLAGLARTGVHVGWGPSHAWEHGPLMVVGVFGTVIALERTVALAQSWAFAAPVTGAVAAFATLSGMAWGPWAAVLSAASLLAINAEIVRRQSLAFTWMMLAGSVVLLLGNLAWALGRPLFQVAPAWMGFFVLTIVAERLELSRLAPTPPRARQAIALLASFFALAASTSPVFGLLSPRAFGASMAAMAVWQLRFDLARRTVKMTGLPRFSAVGVLVAALWMLGSGLLITITGLPAAGPLYDAILHGVFVGYVLSMVFAHAPIILPAVARLRLPFHTALYVPLASLHASLLLRVGGDLFANATMRSAGSVGNALSLALFAAAVLHARRTTTAPAA